MVHSFRHFLLIVLVLEFGLAARGICLAQTKILFDRDIRPILADNCYACHGPDEASSESDLRLDQKDSVFGDLGGYAAVVPGNTQDSELIRRILSDDADEIMPPAHHRKKLTDAQKQTLVQWVEQGAPWSSHWAFTAPKVTDNPAVRNREWPINFIDYYVLSELERQGIEPSPAEKWPTLLRRLHFDLTGLPPTIEELESFELDTDPGAYDRAVERLLSSPHFGERMAVYWLDLVRYADTVGYHGDQPVSVSPYRDYVIDAFNRNMPFDQFTLEQLAGDLLENPTRDQLVASGYNRLGMMSAEGGVQPEEYLNKYASDRVRTTASTWTGLTLGCAECHDHKFDPVGTREFYEFAAFFADIQERGLYEGAHESKDWGPRIEVPDDELPELLEPIDRQIGELKSQILDSPHLAIEQAAWEDEIVSKSLNWTVIRVGPATIAVPADQIIRDLPNEVRQALALDEEERTDVQRQNVRDYFLSISPRFAETWQQIAVLEKQRAVIIDAHTPTSPITVSVPPREVRVLPRGNWMDKSGAVVSPNVPVVLGRREWNAQPTRKDLAQWLVSGENPLTARVFVNRIWALMMGSGLAPVLDDFGAQGAAPSHPELLDRLAVEFVNSGWDVKQLVREIVSSQTYRQSSAFRDDLKTKDPENRLRARQSRFRLPAEFIRDNLLATSGLLFDKIGGRSVFPYQPVGLYRNLNFPTREYQASVGNDQYRRGLYTHWQRQYLHPAMKTFDAPAREECQAARPRSSTPLGALLMLNDPTVVEASRALADKAIAHNAETENRLDFIYLSGLGRRPSSEEQVVLQQLLEQHQLYFNQNPESAKALLATGQYQAASNVTPSELAAWTSVCRAVFNLHEFIQRR